MLGEVRYLCVYVYACVFAIACEICACEYCVLLRAVTFLFCEVCMQAVSAVDVCVFVSLFAVTTIVTQNKQTKSQFTVTVAIALTQSHAHALTQTQHPPHTWAHAQTDMSRLKFHLI